MTILSIKDLMACKTPEDRKELLAKSKISLPEIKPTVKSIVSKITDEITKVSMSDAYFESRLEDYSDIPGYLAHAEYEASKGNTELQMAYLQKAVILFKQLRQEDDCDMLWEAYEKEFTDHIEKMSAQL